MAPSILALSGLDTPSVEDEDPHFDYHVIASFFIGWVFFYSVSCIISSPAAKSLVHLLLKKRQRQANNFGASPVKTGSDVESITSSISPSKRDSRTLLLIMSLSFATGSLANFGSLMSFDSGSGLCDFVVAWGELTFMTARLMGLLILLFSLRQMGIARWESIVFLVWLFIGLAFIFFNSAVATGVTTSFGSSPQLFFCYRKHFLPASLVTSVLYILLELIVLGRFWFLLASDSFSRYRGWSTLFDLRILRTLSLLLLDGLTIVPSAIVTNTLGEFIPLTIGSLALLIAFNASWDNSPVPRTISAPFDFRTIIPPSLPERLPTHQIRSLPSGVAPVIMFDHPYSAVLLKDAHGSPEGLVESPQSFQNSRASLPSPHFEASLTHHPNNSLGLTVDVNRHLPNGTGVRPLSTGKSEVYPASVMSSRVVKATRLNAQSPSDRARPQLYIVTSPAASRSDEQSTLDISPRLRSRFSLPTTKSESPSTISYPNPTVLSVPILSSDSDMEHQIRFESSPEASELQLNNWDVIQTRHFQRMSSLEFDSRPLPRTPT